MTWTTCLVVLNYAIALYVLGRVMLRPYREPASRVAWMLVIAGVPVFGILFYFMFGETNIGFERAERMRKIQSSLFQQSKASLHEPFDVDIPERYQQLFRIAQSVNGFMPVGGNHGEIMANSEKTIDALVKDIDEAQHHVHLLFYIWLADTSGLKVIDALCRAAGRGVVCRVLADALGSRSLIDSTYWEQMEEAGVRVAYALPIGNPIMRMLFGRIDLRNHRKIMVIDNRITYCGSQNCADAAFSPKPKYAPWVDTVVRFTGPIVLQNQRLFASDWQLATHENLETLWLLEETTKAQNCPALVIGTGPTERHSAMPDVFLTLIACARDELIITTPYFVPNESIFNALCIAARSGASVTLNVPRRNDSWIVAAASRSYYQALLKAGVKIYEYTGGLLHAKLLTIDGEVTMLGSANLDRRSFDLNYENNIVLYDKTLTQTIIERQQGYIDASVRVTLSEVEEWTKPKLLWYNTVATMGPVL
ncbi:cardiolipin synthase [Hydromonas duriensis]|uniref:Cardiolipin synthase n=1 Tax=Hydromonas duriensis TaxID=1527608 RepID=A0A4R6Y3G8_9BURK|nr:cardiolipin synthase [Hydromonas duriensis]TDR31087.1 cardiolipin synthase [Hydromonas duriensis]